MRFVLKVSGRRNGYDVRGRQSSRDYPRLKVEPAADSNVVPFGHEVDGAGSARAAR